MRVATVLVNYNNVELTLACIESLQALRDVDNRIVVVENGSRNDSLERLRALGDAIELVEIHENDGFAPGNNAGVERALADGVEYVWVLNNDTVVDPGSLRALIDCMGSDPKIGAVGSKIYYFDPPDLLWYAGGDFHRCGWSSHRGIREVDEGQYDRTEDTGFITGCSILVKREVLDAVGLMDTRYFLYWEDADWSTRIHRAGWRTVYCPASLVWHKVSATVGTDVTMMAEYEARNRVLYEKRFGGSGWRIGICTAAQGLWGLFRGHPKLAYYYPKGVLRGLRGETGRIEG